MPTLKHFSAPLVGRNPQSIHMEVFLSHRGTPKSSKSLDHDSIEINGDLGIHHFKKLS